MALKLSVKIGDVTNLSDARYAAGMGVDFIGFNIDSKAKNHVTPTAFKQIVNWISGVGIIGEIGNNPNGIEEGYPDFLTESSNASLLPPAQEAVLRICGNNISITDLKPLVETQKGILFYVVELSTVQIEENVQFLHTLCSNYPIYISTDFTESLLEIITSQIKPKGVEIKGSLEEQPGLKDYDGIADVLEWLEEED